MARDSHGTYHGAMPRSRITNLAIVLSFGLFGFGCRLAFQATHTRLQILVVCLLAIAIDRLIKPFFDLAPSRTWAAAAAAAGTAGLLLARWHLEGLCPHHHLRYCLP